MAHLVARVFREPLVAQGAMALQVVPLQHRAVVVAEPQGIQATAATVVGLLHLPPQVQAVALEAVERRQAVFKLALAGAVLEF